MKVNYGTFYQAATNKKQTSENKTKTRAFCTFKHANPQFQDLSPDSENTLRASADIPSSELAYKDVF